MATRILRAGYFWPTMETDCQDYVKKCKPCQKHGNLIHQKQEQLHHILSPWPFAKWGMDILGPFTPGKGQVKFLIVAVDYFTKWIEAKPLTPSRPSRSSSLCGRTSYADMVYRIPS